ncbi:Tetratricopeptide repeat-containing protein [Tenacibaculum sp. MAR_2009_124]|uniref:tetratricopeptide repeat protein n=1 Tax=Tenacibaculum sp. MAR_2009_124 TaxID=1250059 RepID=UPI00089A9AB8|nr:tetratricopeptide repeat protein [Tenacibaculum sp. MAR_2009_124]SEB35280.1 Tetratricopeptide repeat-containing protein [Tenacibaculum sp. MAR_2009_124]
MGNNYERGIQLYELNRFTDASKKFQEALQETPDDFYSMYYLSLCYYHLNNLSQMKTTSEALISNFPDRSESHYLASIYHLTNNHVEKAHHFITNSISINPYEATYFGHKSLIEISKKQFTLALNTSNKGLNIDPKNKICLNARTKALTKLDKKEEAFETIKNTLQDNPDDDFTHANAGWVNLELDNHKKAQIHFKESLKHDPENEYAREGMLESIKAQNSIYRYFLKYSFWMQKKSSKYRWGIFIGLYLIYRVSLNLSENAGLTFIVPIIIFIYFSFVLGTWIITPISNAILLSNTYTKFLLDSKDKNAAIAFILLFFLGTSSVIIYYISPDSYLLFLITTIFCSIIPITHSLQRQNLSFRNIGLFYGILILLLVPLNVIFDMNLSIVVPILMFVAYTWLSGFINTDNE